MSPGVRARANASSTLRHQHGICRAAYSQEDDVHANVIGYIGTVRLSTMHRHYALEFCSPFQGAPRVDSPRKGLIAHMAGTRV